MIQHQHSLAVKLLQRAADLGSSEACLNLGTLLAQGLQEHGDSITVDEAQAANYLITGLRIECDRSPSNDPHDGTTATSVSTPQMPPEKPSAKVSLDLELTAHLAHTLVSLYRRGALTPDTGSNLGKGKGTSLWDQGVKVARTLIDHPAIEPVKAHSGAQSDDLWLPAVGPPSQRPPSDFRRSSSRVRSPQVSLTSSQQLRRSIYVAFAYLLALVAYDTTVRAKRHNYAEALRWWGKCIDIDNQPGGAGTREAQSLIVKARSRVDILLAAQRRAEESTQMHRLSPYSASTSSHTGNIAEDSPTTLPFPTSTLLESPDLEGKFQQTFQVLMPKCTRRHSNTIQSIHPISNGSTPKSTDRRPQLDLHIPQAVRPSKSKFEIISPSSGRSDSKRSSFSSNIDSKAIPRRARTLTAPTRRGAALRLLAGSNHRAFPSSTSACHISDELVGIPRSGHRHRASLSSLFSEAELEPDCASFSSTRSRTLSSASISSLPHLVSPRNGEEPATRKRTNSLFSSFAPSRPHFASVLPSPSTLSEVDQEEPESEAVESLSTILRNDLIAEQDYNDWAAEDQSSQDGEADWGDVAGPDHGAQPNHHHLMPSTAELESVSSENRQSSDELHTPPPQTRSPCVRILSPSREEARGTSPPLVEMPEAKLTLHPPKQERPRKPRSKNSLDPTLSALEASSMLNRRVKCSTCGVKGINFREFVVGLLDIRSLIFSFAAACSKCSNVYCSRDCRLAETGCGHAPGAKRLPIGQSQQ